MYKDKEKQREANRRANKRYRDKQGITEKVSRGEGITEQGVIADGFKDIVLEVAPIIEVKVKPKRSYIGAVPETPDTTSPKRGKDIKCFADLPPDVQQTINLMSRRDGKIDPIEKAKRTTAAIKYQHLFPHKYDSPSPLTDVEIVAVTGKPGDADYNGICTEEWRQARGR